jgi:PAS domain S-box-containing protein
VDNQTWLDFTGRSLDEEWGVGWAESVHFEDFQRCFDTYVDAFNTRQVFEVEYRLRRHDGEYRWILDRGTPRYWPDGTFAGFIGSCVDITARKQLERELLDAVRARDEFLSIASHELKTPLTSLQLQLESLLRTLGKKTGQLPDSERIGRNAAMAFEKTLHLGEMINVLLDVTRIAEGRLHLDCEEVELGRLARDVVQRLNEPASRAGCAIELYVEDEAGGMWDRFRIEQVLTNVLTNAIKYGAGMPVEMTVSRRGDSARVSVVDHGPGISAEHQRRIFERFARFAPAKHYGGFGLGLWISREVVEAHGGHIAVESRAGSGTTFHIDLPIRPQPRDRPH